MARILLICLFAIVFVDVGQAQDVYRSHPPLRKAPPPAARIMAQGPALFVDAKNGNDADKGSKDSPWKTLRHAVNHLKAGDTLYLRGGTYYETLALRLVGTKEAPITLRSFPGEQAVLDGGMREFYETPADVWEPAPGAAPGEYRSKRPYANLRHVIGR